MPRSRNITHLGKHGFFKSSRSQLGLNFTEDGLNFIFKNNKMNPLLWPALAVFLLSVLILVETLLAKRRILLLDSVKPLDDAGWPSISVIIPALNEEWHI